MDHGAPDALAGKLLITTTNKAQEYTTTLMTSLLQKFNKIFRIII